MHEKIGRSSEAFELRKQLDMIEGNLLSALGFDEHLPPLNDNGAEDEEAAKRRVIRNYVLSLLAHSSELRQELN